MQSAMTDPTVWFPVSCPECGRDSVTQMPLIVLSACLRPGQHLLLYAECHRRFWNASDFERDHIRAYVAASELGQHQLRDAANDPGMAAFD
jgi:hypothetical protein